jgi:hypothetical protein
MAEQSVSRRAGKPRAPKSQTNRRTAAASTTDTTPRPRDQLYDQRDEVFNVMATLYVVAEMLDGQEDRGSPEANYISRVLRAAYEQADRIADALDSIAAGVANG